MKFVNTKNIGFLVVLTASVLIASLALGMDLAPTQAHHLDVRQGFASLPPQAPQGSAAALGTAFTYQGRLEQGGAPATGAFDFEFELYDALSEGAQVGSTLTREDVILSHGIFSLELDFGSVFDGVALYLQIGVRPGDSTGAYSTIGARQALSAVAYALYAQSAPWAGLRGVPAGFADGVDESSTYTAGSGLVLDGDQFAVDPDTVQARISGSCQEDDTLRAINPDGTLVCEARQPAFSRTILDSEEDVGWFTSIAIGADGLGLISYQDDANEYLKVAHCEDVACTSATITTLDNAGTVGKYTSIAIGADGLGLIAYYDRVNEDLKVAHCNDTTCTGATITILDNVGDIDDPSISIAIGADGLGLLGYFDALNNDLKVAHCDDVACTGATITPLDSAGEVGSHTSIAVGADGLGLISYLDITNDALKVAHCNDAVCTSATTSTLESAESVGRSTSITIGTDGLGLISYYDTYHGELKVAHCNDAACTNASLAVIETGGDVGYYNSIAIGADGFGLISYLDIINADLKVAHCDDTACSSASLLTLDSIGAIGWFNAIAIGADGLGLISYYDFDNGNLKVAHCDDLTCTP
jgi:hypothetical protein